jgi:hypothetical protein
VPDGRHIEDDHTDAIISQLRAFRLVQRVLCETYDATLGTVTTQCIGALLDAAHAIGHRTLDIATGPGYVAGAALKRGAQATGLDFPRRKSPLHAIGILRFPFRPATRKRWPLPMDVRRRSEQLRHAAFPQS